MKLSDMNILHMTNNLGIGGVQKIIYQICDITKDLMGKIIVVSTGGVFEERLSFLGIQHIKIPDVSTKNPVNVYKIIKLLKKVVKKNNINVIHCHHRMSVLYAKIVAPNAKIIYNNHTIYADKPNITKLILKNVNIIADGEMAKKNAYDFFNIPKNKITTINNAVDCYDGIFNEISEINEKKQQGNFIVASVARLHPQKGINYFIDSAEILINKGYNIAFFIVGDGPLREEVLKQIELKKLEKNITFLGFRNDIKNVISQIDLLVLTSLYEGLPLTPMEAFSVKKTVVATDIDGTREVINDGYSGLLAETKNPEDIAKKIEYLFLNNKVLNLMEKNAYNEFIDKFSIEKFKNSYLNFYRLIN